MHALFTRLLFLLISANVAYGTSGDIYAEEIQGLILPFKGVQYAYNPDVNSELFCSTRYKEAKSHTQLSREKDRKAAERDTLSCVLLPLHLSNQLESLYKLHSAYCFYLLQTRSLIFPSHFFL